MLHPLDDVETVTSSQTRLRLSLYSAPVYSASSRAWSEGERARSEGERESERAREKERERERVTVPSLRTRRVAGEDTK